MEKLIRVRSVKNNKMKEFVRGIAWGEGLRWHQGQLYFSDIYGQKVYCAADGMKEELAKLDDMPSGLGFLLDGSLLIVSGGKRQVVRLKDKELSVYADFSGDCVGLNDMVVDKNGHAYVGAYGFEIHNYRGGKADGWLYHIDPNGKAERVCEGLAAPNGIVVTEDEKTLIVADTFLRKLFAYTLDEFGTPRSKREWATLSSGPDGICLDAEGAIWAALPNEQKVVRVFEGGMVSKEFTFSETPLCCALGGKERKTLFIVTVPAHKELAVEELSDFDTQRKKLASSIQYTPVHISGAGYP